MYERNDDRIDIGNLRGYMRTITDWFRNYQGECDDGQMVNLYRALIEEETEELHEAIRNDSVVELLDAYADLVWVSVGLEYFHYRLRGYDLSSYDPTATFYRVMGWDNPLNQLVADVIGEVSRSNWTKSKQLNPSSLKFGKVIKGYGYSAPNIPYVIARYYP